MEDIRSIYPGLEEPFYGPGDYSPILLSFDAEIVLAADDQDYQGDSYVLYRRGDSFGVLIFGWGSCSGCDALPIVREKAPRLRAGMDSALY